MTAGVSLPDAPPPVADRAVFSTNGVVFTVADLVRHAGVGDRGAFLGASRAEQAEEAFRRAHGLLRADQLESWLGTWHIAAEDFRCWTQDVASGSSTTTGWCALLCSGEFERIAAEVASAAAAACELGEGPYDAAAFDPEGWADRLVARDTSTASLVAAIEAHRLDWTRLTTVDAVTTHRGLAEELRHQVLNDEIDLASAAARAGCVARETTEVLGAVPAGVRAAIAGARPGDLVGPVPVGAAWTVISVTVRTTPTLSDPSSRSRAEAVVRTDVITRALARHVVA